MPETDNQTKTADQAAPAATNRDVTFEVTLNGETKTEAVRFHTPSLLERVKTLDDAATVRILAPAAGDERRVLLEGTKAQATLALEASIIKPEQISEHLKKLVQLLADHSSLRAIGVEVVYVDNEGRDSGFGFVSTSVNCTTAQAVALVNCCDANVDEFISKAKLSIPGRNEPAKGGIVTPTEEQVKALG